MIYTEKVLARLKRRAQRRRTTNDGASEQQPAQATVTAHQQRQQQRLQQTTQERQQVQTPLLGPTGSPLSLPAPPQSPIVERQRQEETPATQTVWEWSAPPAPSAESNPQKMRIDSDILHSSCGTNRPAETIAMLARAPEKVRDFFNRAPERERRWEQTEQERFFADDGSFA
jgi:hypothetical protein